MSAAAQSLIEKLRVVREAAEAGNTNAVATLSFAQCTTVEKMIACLKRAMTVESVSRPNRPRTVISWMRNAEALLKEVETP